ncbi:MAG: hypothetical protein HY016_09210 [Nitrosomonadales bacterium]|nr:hypothetical protein [Nitrosomonadales bacterium]
MPDFPDNLRLILAHKQSTSAWVRFLCFAHGISAFSPLPQMSSFDEATPAPQVVHHPGVYLRAAEARLGLQECSLRHEPEFVATVQTPGEAIAVNLALIATIDPPFSAAETIGARFIAITEARDCSDVELNLLRHAYPILI